MVWTHANSSKHKSAAHCGIVLDPATCRAASESAFGTTAEMGDAQSPPERFDRDRGRVPVAEWHIVDSRAGVSRLVAGPIGAQSPKGSTAMSNSLVEYRQSLASFLARFPWQYFITLTWDPARRPRLLTSRRAE